MRKIATIVNNKQYETKIENFCKQEKLTFLTIKSLDDIADFNNCIIITDYDSSSFKNIETSSALCFISDSTYLHASYSIPTSFSDISLRLLLDAVFHATSFKSFDNSVQNVQYHKKYIIKNDFYNIDKIVFSITADLAVFFKFSDLEKIRTGISEILTNSIEHGNLNITSEEKQQALEDNAYNDLLKSRLNDDKYMKLVVKLEIDYTDNTLTINVKDEGKGFNVSELPDPTDPEALLKLHGRGILMTRMYFDEVKYNKKGNQVTLIKENI